MNACLNRKLNMSVPGNVTQHSKGNRSMEERFSKDELWFQNEQQDQEVLTE